MTKTFLDKTYGLDTVDATLSHYAAWSKSYDTETTQNGYATPARIAQALAAQTQDRAAPILDFGCGTGLSGAALARVGFETIDGMDVSQDMLAEARAKDIYRDLKLIDAKSAPPIAPGHYGSIVACGVIGSGAAPLRLLDALTGSLAPGARLAFSFNDSTLKDPSYKARVNALLADGHRMVMQDYGDHLPGIDMKSEIYILEKL